MMTAAEQPPILCLSPWRTGQRCPRRVNGNAKRRAWRRSVAAVDTILVHATAVKGGFGVTTAQLRQARDRLAAKGFDETIPGYGWGTEATRREATRREAIEERYREQTYHGIYSPSMRTTIVQWGAGEYTYHGDKANSCPLRRVSPHANHSRKPHDPGPLVWLEVVRPVADEYGLELALDWTTGNGQPWARRWMDGAA